MTDYISESVTWIVVEPTPGTRIPSVISWSRTDPFALKAIFYDSDIPVEWTFARDLLLGAFTDLFSGDCDIKIAYRKVDEKIEISLSSAIGPGITIETAAAPLRDFLNRTFALVSAGEEDTTEAIETAIRRILEDV